MALSTSLRIVSYNCRGWKSGCHLVRDISDSFDFCFIQEHWLLELDQVETQGEEVEGHY